MPAKAKKSYRKAPKNQHQLCDPLPEGEVLTDLQKKSWKLGKTIGSGGFGLIYMADENSNSKVADDAQYVIKIEPHGNGPLFSEIAFYQRVCKADKIKDWTKRSKLPYVGVPAYIAHGLHQCNGASLRFMVMPRYGENLHDLWLKADKKFKRETVAKIAIIMLDALEYIHNHEYVHADIKGANILCGYEDAAKLFLVDYGLAYRYSVDKEHRRDDRDPKKAHNGTIEYTSRDAHRGSNPSRRGDIEILGLVLLHFLSGKLPWEDKLGDCNYVFNQKTKYLNNVESFVKQSYSLPAPEITQLFQHANGLEYEDTPDYSKLRNNFKNALKSLGGSRNSLLDFSRAQDETSLSKTTSKRAGKPRSANQQRASSCSPSPPKKMKKPRTRAVASSSTTSDEDFVEKYPTSRSGKRKQNTNKIPSSSQSGSGKNANIKQKKSKKVSDDEDIDSASETSRSRITSTGCSSSEYISETSSEKIVPKSASEEDKSPTKENLRKASSISKKSSSRHSMAPLHTSTVLTKSDKLTGKYSGKHPVFMRRRKKNVPKTTVSTQTTPSLHKTRSRK